jgi:N-acetylglucosaminyldiphosphoundecaprenol N-acetyl-beta-D-mannosaminyltransferase
MFYSVLGVPISVTNLPEAIETIAGWAAGDVARYVCVRDVHGVVRAVDDAALLQIHRDADMVAPDGMPLVWLGRIRGLPVSRSCGYDLMGGLIERSAELGLRQYFLGGKPGVAELLRSTFQQRYPKLEVAGVHCPPFAEISEYDIEEIAGEIRESGAQIVWVGLSTPRQEFLMSLLAKRTAATLIGVGAAFDFHTGQLRRAPKWMQRAGLEWLFRVEQDPTRLGPRYLSVIPRVVGLLVMELLRRKHRAE